MCYGDVLKVKFLYTMEDACMIEMKSNDSATNGYKYLDGVTAFGTKLKVRNQKKDISVVINGEGFLMPCGGLSMMDFSSVEMSNEVVQSDPAYPSSDLRFSGLPFDITDDQIKQLLSKNAINGPLSLLISHDEQQNGLSLWHYVF